MTLGFISGVRVPDDRSLHLTAQFINNIKLQQSLAAVFAQDKIHWDDIIFLRVQSD